MIIVKLLGGLGNQMFQYAAAKALSLSLKEPIRQDLRGLYAGEDIRKNFELDIFGIAPDQAERSEYFKFERKTIFGLKAANALYLKFNPHVTIKDHNFTYVENFFALAKTNTYLRGLFQSDKYFAHVRPAILETFSFEEPLDEVNQSYADAITSSESVAIHIRRGEFANDQKFNKLIGSCDLAYYQRAIDALVEGIEQKDKLHFFVFSDDLAWAEENLKLDYPATFVGGNAGKNSYRDMQLMSLCKHNIIANSTFSWWSAWLNSNPGKIVVTPEKWFAGWEYDTKDLIPETWLKR